MKYTLTQLCTYPVKSLKGICQDRAQLCPTGFLYDRHWMLCTPHGQFLTQRELPKLALFETAFADGGVLVKHHTTQQLIPFQGSAKKEHELTATIFGREVLVQREEKKINHWFSEQLGREVILVRKAARGSRHVKRHPEAEIHFPDGHQFLLLGEASLEELNRRLKDPIPIDRFRPNMVFSGGASHTEDQWQSIQIGEALFTATKNCARCQITTVDQSTGIPGQEPLMTLATYRRQANSVLFGRYFKLTSGLKEPLKVGDEVIVRESLDK